VLELVIERITQRSLGEELRQRIFEPVELHNTSYPAEDDLSLPAPYIHGYEQAGEAWRDCSQVFFGRGDGAIISTATDQARFFRALFDGQLLPTWLLTQMTKIVPDIVLQKSFRLNGQGEHYEP
jgi:D-alanyl-D-alanine carboxypeptidase